MSSHDHAKQPARSSSILLGGTVVAAPAVGRERKAVRCKAKTDTGARRCDAWIIEIEVDGITIRAGRGADATMIASIVQALKASR